MSRFTHFLEIFGQKKCLFGSKTVFLGQKVHYYMVYIAYFIELILQICDCAQKRRIWRENCKYAFDENFRCHFCSRGKAAKFCHPDVTLHWLGRNEQIFINILRELQVSFYHTISRILNVLISLNGQRSFKPMKDRDIFTLKQTYLNVSLVEKKWTDFNQYSERTPLIIECHYHLGG